MPSKNRVVPLEIPLFFPAQIIVGLGIVGYATGRLLLGLAKLSRNRKERL